MATLTEFIDTWDNDYRKAQAGIPILDPQQTTQLSRAQQQYFARVFYHARGQFYRFLWLLGTKAPDREAKEMILGNYREEFGGDSPSHEQLYFRFATALGIDVSRELFEERYYLPFLREYNNGHLGFLHEQDWDTCRAAFAAYERLDNADYEALLTVAKSFGLEGGALDFFEEHRTADHFEMVSDGLGNIWISHPHKVQHGFTFIGHHQNGMWEGLSNAVFGYIPLQE